MGKMPERMKRIIAKNIKLCRIKKFPGRGGGQKCAKAFGVTPQQWSPWETGVRTPDESKLEQIAHFFEVTVDELRRDNGNHAALSGNKDLAAVHEAEITLAALRDAKSVIDDIDYLAAQGEAESPVHSGEQPAPDSRESVEADQDAAKGECAAMFEKDRQDLAKMLLEERDRLDDLYRKVAPSTTGASPYMPLQPPAPTPIWHSTNVYTGKNQHGETRVLEIRMMPFPDGTQEVRFRE